LIIPDVRQHPGWVVAETAGHVRNWLAVPLVAGNKTIGMYSLDKVEPGYFTPEHQRLAENLAAQAAIAFQNATLFRNQQVAREQAETLRAAASALGSTLSLGEVFELILSELRKVVPYDSCSVQQLDNNEMVIVGGHGFPNLDELLGKRFDWRGSDDPAGEVVRSRKPVMIADVSARFEHFKDETHGLGRVHGWLGVPLLFGERLIGMITLDKLEKDFYTAEHAHMAQAFATQAATAIENARLFETEQIARQQAETLRAAALALGSTLSLQRVFELILSELRKVVPYDSCSVQQLDGNTMVIVGGHGFPNLDELIGNRFDWRGPDDPAGEVVHSFQPVIIADVSARFKHFKDETHGQGRVHGWLGVPLLFGERMIGMLTLDKLEKDFYTPEHAHMAQGFATQAATAIENARLFNETERLLKLTEERAQELAILNSVGEAMAKTLDVKTVTRIVGDKVRDIFGAEVTEILLREVTSDLIQVPYAFAKNYQDVEPFALGTGLTSKVIISGKPLILGTFEQGVELGALTPTEEDKTESYMGVPIVAGEKMLGVVSVQSYKQNAYNQNHIHLLQTLSSNMGVAIENARLFDETQRLLKITEDRAAELAIINSVQEGLASKLEMQAIYDLIGDKIRDIFDAQVVDIGLFDPSDQLLHFPYAIERGERFPDEPMQLVGFRKYVLQTQHPLLINENMVELAAKHGNPLAFQGEVSKACLFVPMLVGGEAKGVISLQNLDHENAFSESDVSLLTTLTNAMSVALENARLFAETQRLLKITEDRAAELAIINSVQEGLASKLIMQAIYDLIGDKIRDIFDAQVVDIGIYDRNEKLLHFPYTIERG
ncbi:MAG: GAF domain-containing protein, partial [Chloroflexi bacterium]|nr:GAF domain-containing protein [Chloroflexota bacterium]